MHRRVAWEHRGWRGVGVAPGHPEVRFASVETGSVWLGSKPTQPPGVLAHMH